MITPRESNAIAELKASKLFVAEPKLLERTMWRTFRLPMRNGKSLPTQTLMLKPSADYAPLSAASVEFIGEVSSESFRLLVDAGYNEYYQGELSAQKAVAFITPPPYPAYEAIWKDVEEAVFSIQHSIQNQKAIGVRNSLFQYPPGGIRVRHSLFTQVTRRITRASDARDKENDEPSTSQSADPDEEEPDSEDQPIDPFSPEAWVAACGSERSKEIMQKMVDSKEWKFHPIPAFGVDDKLIPPAAYEETLKGAIVRARVAITHQYLTKDGGQDNYYADLQEMTVLAPPSTTFEPAAVERKVQDAFAVIMGQVADPKEEEEAPPQKKRKFTNAKASGSQSKSKSKKRAPAPVR